MSDKKKIIIIIILLILFLLVSVFFCLVFKWYHFFIPTVAVIVIEISCRIWVARHAHITTLSKKGKQLIAYCLNFQNWLKLQGTIALQSSNVPAKTVMPGDQSSIQTQKSQLVFISSIKELKLTDYIKGITGDLLPTILNPKEMYTSEEIEAIDANWLCLRSEFESIRKDKRENEHRKVIVKKTQLELRKVMIGMLCESLKLIYSPILADKLRFYHPDLRLTKETYLQDIKIIGNKEVRNREHFEELKKMLEKNIKGAENDNQNIEASFRSYISGYNNAFNQKYNIRELYADDYAYMCMEYDKYVTDLKYEYDKTKAKK